MFPANHSPNPDSVGPPDPSSDPCLNFLPPIRHGSQVTKRDQYNRWMSSPWVSDEARRAQKNYLVQVGNGWGWAGSRERGAIVLLRLIPVLRRRGASELDGRYGRLW